MDGPIPRSWSPYLQSALRVIAAFLFVPHGTQKLFAAPASAPATRSSCSRCPGWPGSWRPPAGRCCSWASSPARSRSCWRGRWPRPTLWRMPLVASGRCSTAASRRSSSVSSGCSSRPRGPAPSASTGGGRVAAWRGRGSPPAGGPSHVAEGQAAGARTGSLNRDARRDRLVRPRAEEGQRHPSPRGSDSGMCCSIATGPCLPRAAVSLAAIGRARRDPACRSGGSPFDHSVRKGAAATPGSARPGESEMVTRHGGSAAETEIRRIIED